MLEIIFETGMARELAAFRENLRQTNPMAEVIELSARTGEGLGVWLDWLRAVGI